MTCYWRDGRGNRIAFEVYGSPSQVSWNEVGGIYIMAKAAPDGRTANALYVGKTGSFAERMPDHEVWPRALRLGASEIHAVVVDGLKARALLERSLIRHLAPPLNVQFNVRANALRLALARQLQENR